jgi:putative glutathione S-transferase
MAAGAKAGWKLAWETMMKELAPQNRDGSYARPTYNLKGILGSDEFPVGSQRSCSMFCHRFLGLCKY